MQVKGESHTKIIFDHVHVQVLSGVQQALLLAYILDENQASLEEPEEFDIADHQTQSPEALCFAYKRLLH